MRDRLKQAWKNMHKRCKLPSYSRRGITVCARWHDYSLFAGDMGPHPGQGQTLERVKNHLGYVKTNCIWAPMTTQSRNRRSNKLTLAQVQAIRAMHGTDGAIALQFGVSRPMIWQIRHGKVWQ
jgi:hypothetical protein